jgi:hypothetical protein
MKTAPFACTLCGSRWWPDCKTSCPACQPSYTHDPDYDELPHDPDYDELPHDPYDELPPNPNPEP